MTKMTYREMFFTAVLVFGMAALLFGPGQPQGGALEAGASPSVTIQRAG